MNKIDRTFEVAGTAYRDPQKVQAVLAKVAANPLGLSVWLQRESANEYDRNAIMVRIDGVHVGYVPRDLARKLAPLLDAGEPCAVALAGVRRTEYSVFLQVRVQI